MKRKFSFILMAFIFAFSVNTFAKDKAKETVVFHVKMDCISCKNKIEKNIAFEKGVTDLKVNLPSQTVSVTFKTNKNTIDGLISAFKKLGYEATVANETESKNSILENHQEHQH